MNKPIAPDRHARLAPLAAAASALAAAALLGSCGGGGGSAAPPPPPPPPPPPAVRIASAATPIAATCTGLAVGVPPGTFFANAEVEPFAAIHPTNPNVLIAAWQQDRWSSGGARAVMSAVSRDGGATWTRFLHPMSRCAGATAGAPGDYERATDPWVDVSPDGTMHMMGLAISGSALQPGSVSAMLASRSTDGGNTWSAPATLVREGPAGFHDKNSLTADPLDSRFVYAVWDRIDSAGNGPALLARSIDGGLTWEAARTFYTPSTPAGTGSSQTIGNRIVVPTAGPARGVLVNVFTQIDRPSPTTTTRVAVIRSSDRGLTWGAPVFIAEHRAVGARDDATGQAIRDGAIIPNIAAGPDGTLWVAWQDARFSAGARDAIAVSRSTDGGNTWSAPVAVNRVATTPAFTPTMVVRADGLIALTHYDLRNNTADPATLLADAWLLTTRDGTTWNETRITTTSFDIGIAPVASGGLFLGDYHGLVAAGTSLIPVLVLANADTNNRTDVYTPRFDGITTTASFSARSQAPVLDATAAAALQKAHSAAVDAYMEQRIPGWTARQRER